MSSNESVCSRLFLSKVADFSEEFNIFEKENARLLNYQRQSRKPMNEHGDDKTNTFKVVQTNISQSGTLLKKILEDTDKLDATIIIRKKRRDEIMSSDGNEISLSNNENETKLHSDGLLCKISMEEKRLLATKNTLQKLLNIELPDVTIKKNGVLAIQLILNKVKVLFELDSTHRLVEIKILSQNTPGLEPIENAAILRVAEVFPPPQDIRAAVNYILTIQNAPIQIQRDIIELRKLYLVNVLGALRLQLTFSNGINTCFRLHEAYSSVPKGVYIEWLVGVGGWDQDNLNALQQRANCHSFRTLPDAVGFLMKNFEEM